MTRSTTSLDPITTHVGAMGWDDHPFRGYLPLADLLEESSHWSVYSLAVGHRRLTPDECSVLDGVITSSLSADPRIWPLKITHLVASYGRSAPGICAALLATDHGSVGSSAYAPSARLLCELADEVGPDLDPAAVTAAVDRLRDAGQRFSGFGVPARPRDERLVGIEATVRRSQREDGRYWRLANLVGEHLAATAKLPLNLGGASAAILLDMGFTPDQVEGMALLFLFPNIVASAAESAKVQAESLRALPDAWVNYTGKPHRPSPRSSGQSVDDSLKPTDV